MAIFVRLHTLVGAVVVCLAITTASAAAAPVSAKRAQPGGPPSSTSQQEALASAQHATTTSKPAWAASLGRGVTITEPGTQPASGTASPGGVVEAEFAATDGGHLAQGCAYLEPAVQMKCSSDAATAPPFSIQDHLSLGYIAVKGTQALVALVGTDCQSDARPRCITNRNAATFFSSRHTFSALYRSALASEASPVHKYSLITCVRVGSQWYEYEPPRLF
jgi:hypothetical protein